MGYVEAVNCDSAKVGPWKMSQNPGPIKMLDSCLDANNAQLDNGQTPVMLKPCDGSASQNFTLTKDGEIKIGSSCLDVWDFAGPLVDIYACNGGYNQKFTFTSDGHLQENT